MDIVQYVHMYKLTCPKFGMAAIFTQYPHLNHNKMHRVPYLQLTYCTLQKVHK